MPADDPLDAQGVDTVGRIPSGVRDPPWLLAAGGAVAAAVLLIALVGALIDQGSQFAFDRAILLAARGGSMHGTPVGPAWLAPTMVDVTALGGPTILAMVVALTCGFLAVRRLWLTMGLVLGGTVTGSIGVALAKGLVARPRPELTDHLVTISSASFPSGHAANSAIIYLTLATILMQIVEGRAARSYILAAAALLVVAIGCSRVYLGVHWPSDVLAGWSFGILWALAWWMLGARIRLGRRDRAVPDQRA
jgi:undecaprenyl-diphosphatase